MSQLNKSEFNICVVGLGYVGLPLAARFALKNFHVIGFDIDKQRIKELNNLKDRNEDISQDNLEILVKKSFLTSDISDVNNCNIFIITVPTPINKDKLISLKGNHPLVLHKHFKTGTICISILGLFSFLIKKR